MMTTVEAMQAENEALRQRVAELEAQFAQTRQIVAQLPHLIYIFDVSAQRNVLANRELAETLGYTPDEIRDMGEHVLPQVIHPDDLSTVIPQHFAKLAAAKDGEVVEVEYRLRHKSGGWRWFLARDVVFTRQEDGSIWQSLGSLQDMTRHKQVEEHLSSSQQQLQFILEGSRDGAWDINLLTGETYYSPRYAEMLGYHPDELAPTVETWLNLIHPDDAAEANRFFHDYLAGNTTEFVFEHRLRHKSGTWKWVLSRGKAIDYTSQGQPSRLAGLMTDITERKQAEEQFRLGQFTLDRVADSIHWITSDGTIVYVNETTCTRLGYTREELLTMRISDLDPSFREEDMELAWNDLKQRGVQMFEAVHRHKDGHGIPVEVVSSYLTFQGQEYACTVSRDITERKRTEAEQAALREQVIAAQRDALRELSTPLLPLDQHVLAMPLVGTIDSSRAQQMMEMLLEGVAHHRAEVVIMDITGVKVVDTQVAQALVHIAQAVRLLGAQVVLTGIQPQIAQTLVHLGADMRGVVTRGTLQGGIAYALQGR
jgi:rsbT co-antagonist protein RsbR